jgi:Uncharacterized protein with conserved CXXC pairs
MKKDLTCICCPLGCQLSVTVENGKVTVCGNTCPRGAAYGEKEVTNPVRVVTSSVKVSGGDYFTLSVKTKGEVPKGRIFDVLKAISGVSVSAPVEIGDVVLTDAAGTGVDIVATRKVSKI